MRLMLVCASIVMVSCTTSTPVKKAASSEAYPGDSYHHVPEAPPVPGAELFIGMTPEELVTQLGRPSQVLRSDDAHFMDYVSAYCRLSFVVRTGRVTSVLPSSPDEKTIAGIDFSTCIASLRREPVANSKRD